ncbi:MAG: NAD(P)-dependent oxidoreductase [Mycobacterium sp.]|jgi:3-hydroxyisobutyrate dehydrogenase-like beta-hydroxyacid dehydrogenase
MRTPSVGFVGLGNMGAAMATRLLDAGFPVTVYNRSAAKTDVLAARGAAVATSVAEACSGDVVITMLANDDAVEAVVNGEGGVLAALCTGATHVSASTISAGLSERLTAAHAAAGQQFITATVLGRPEAVAAGKLFVLAAGPPAAVEPLMPVLDALGQRTFRVSDIAAVGNVVKLSANFLLATVIESLGEAIALVSKAGVDQQDYVDIITSTLFSAPAYVTYGDLIARGEFEPAGFAARLGIKDIRLVLAAAEDLRVPLPIASLLRDRFLALLASGGGDLDWSAIATLAQRDAGL